MPGPEGEVSTWLVAGAVSTPRSQREAPVDAQLQRALPGIDFSHPRAGTALGPVRGLRWIPAATADARLDLDTVLHGHGGRGARTAFVGAELRVTRAGVVRLMLGSDDGLAVYLNGTEVYRRGAVREVRDDDDLVELDLSPGRYRLVLRLYVRGGRMRLQARMLDGAFVPASHVQLVLPGVDDVQCARLARAAMHIDVQREVVVNGTRVRMEVSYPGGSVRRDSERERFVRFVVRGASVAQGRVDLSGTAVAPVSLEAVVSASSGRLEQTDLSGDFSLVRSVDLSIEPSVRDVLLRARAVVAPLSENAPPPWLPRASLTSVRGVIERLEHLVSTADRDRNHLLSEARMLSSLLDAIERRSDPYASLRGPIRRFYRSAVDGSLQSYSVYVPWSYRGDRPFPVVVALHGLGGTAHRMLAVVFGLYDPHESRVHADRHLPALPDTQAIVVAPYGFGDTGYRSLGETDVMQVLEEVRQAYRIDPDRIYITGLSMGGTGAAGIAFRHPDVFAAAAPLCGYHSYFVRRDTRGVRRPWEVFLMEARSNAFWADNGLHLPLYVVHGTLDRPVENSRVLVDRYTELGYRVEAEWPELGHDVWTRTYANGRIVPYFLQYRRDPTPRHIRFRTAGLRWRRSDWVEIDAREARDQWAHVEAEVTGTTVSVATRGVRALTVSPPATLFPTSNARIEVRIDGQSITALPGQNISLVRGPDGRWIAGPRQTPSVEGPVRDVFDRPIAVVYGTHDPSEQAMNQRVARAWAQPRGAVHVRIPVLADDQVTDAFARGHALVLVGTPRGNSYLAKIHSRLPIQVHDGAIVAGQQRWEGDRLGATFVVENPEAPGWPVVVITGTGPIGIWRSRFLPELVPDFMIYDDGIASARGRVILGAQARVLAAGFFTPEGQLPTHLRDAHEPTNEATPASD